MDWTSIIISLITALFGGGIAGIIMLKPNRKKAESEAEMSSIETQSKSIDLGSKYVSEMIKMMETIRDSQIKDRADADERHLDITKMSENLDKLYLEVKDVKDEVSSIVKYLNGDYKNFKERKIETEV